MTLILTDQQARLVLQSLQNESDKYWKLDKQWGWKSRSAEFKDKHKALEILITHIKEQFE